MEGTKNDLALKSILCTKKIKKQMCQKYKDKQLFVKWENYTL